MRIVRSVATIGGFTMISRVLGFVRDAFIASYLGAGPVADAFFVAFKFPNFSRRLFAEGALNAAFVPMFSRFLTGKGIQQATQMAEQVFAALFLTLFAFVLLVEICLPWLIYILAPGFHATPERLELALIFARITFPYILFISLTALMSGILNSLHRFAAASAAPILLNIAMIGGLLFFRSLTPTVGHTLAWSVTVAGVFQFLWIRRSLRVAGIQLKWQMPKLTPAVKQLLRVMMPGALGAGIIQVNLFVDMIVASFLPVGSVSFLFYADRLNQLPLSVIGIAVSTALLPLLSKHFEKRDHHLAIEAQNRALEFTLFLTLPATLALIILAEPIISVLFERNAFGPLQVKETAATLSAFAIGLPAYIMVKIFSTSFFARYDTRTPVKGALMSLAANFLMNLAFMTTLKHVGIALATALAAWVNVAYLLRYLFKEGVFHFTASFKNKFPRMLLATAIMGSVLGVLLRVFENVVQDSSWMKILVVVTLVGAGMISYLLLGLVLKAFDVEEVKMKLKIREGE